MRFLYLSGGETSLVVDTAPGGAALPRVVHFGANLGDDPNFEALVAAAPVVMWGARLDAPCPPCVVPGLESGYFGTPACAPTLSESWRFVGADLTARGFTLKLSAAEQASIAVDYEMSADGVLATRMRANGFPDGLGAIAAAAFVLPSWTSEVLSFGGDWAREFAAQRQRLGTGALTFESRRGRPGHDRFPGAFIGVPGFGDNEGAVFGVTLGWSGSHRMTVERLREGETVVLAGELHPDGDVPGEPYESPWAYAAFSPRGLNGVMQSFHAHLRSRLPSNVRRPRPVNFNTWEAVYFKHDEAALAELAQRAAEVGAERFVLDDGWFKGRDNDHTSLGDWVADRKKYPQGLGPLIAAVRLKGLQFGLWVEPEMINPESELAWAHPSWLRREADGSLLLQRHQAVLDLTVPEAFEHIVERLNALLSEHPIQYLKWDMNRDVTGVSRAAVPDHGAQVRAVYALIDRLRAAHPGVEIEACASGGGRCDWGMLTRNERVWVSDSNDALDRFDIQRNANLFLPPEVAGVHVGPATCHTTGRKLGLDLRAHVATFGHMGLELDLRQLSETEAQRLAQHIATYKRFRGLLHSGRYWRLSPGVDHVGVCVTSASEALALVVRTGSAELGRGTVLKWPGLKADATYRLSAVAPVTPSAEVTLAPALKTGVLTLGGQVLAQRGLELYLPRPESSLLLHASVVP
ncbi:MAG: alpha-galactosidase [Alphaproteobacteria bacterium]|nr:alpha-galactosidase [Alphaproteobacteria bacterium]